MSPAFYNTFDLYMIYFRLSHLEKTGEPCRDNLLTPFGIRQTATVGHSYRIYCANDGTNSKLLWISPNKTTIEASHPKLRKSSDKRTDYFTTTLLDPSFSRNHEERIHISNEYYGFDVVLENDAGHYECVSKSDMKTITRKIELEVVKPNIYLNASHVATTSVHLNWNRNLKIEAVDRLVNKKMMSLKNGLAKINDTSSTFLKVIKLRDEFAQISKTRHNFLISVHAS